jgi:hypothetical protein
VLRFAADENFNHTITRGLRFRQPDMDIVRVQDVGLSGAHDRAVLEWAARETRVLLTHDVKTVTTYAYDRVRKGMPMPGVVEVNRRMSIASAIEEILLIAECCAPEELEGQILYVPLQ